MTRKKAVTLKDVAKVLSGFSDKSGSSDEDVRIWVGKWTLQYWLTHYFHELIVFSEDRLIFIGLEAMLSLPKRPTAKQAEKICKERWRDLDWLGGVIALNLGSMIYHKMLTQQQVSAIRMK